MLFEKQLRKAAFLAISYRDGHRNLLDNARAFKRFASLDCTAVYDQSLIQLKKILRHAYDNTAYYRELWDNLGVSANLLQSHTDLEKLPCIAKQIIAEQKKQMIAKGYTEKDLEISYTGGTTGTQTSFFRDRKCSETRVGRQLGILERCGYSPGERCGLIWGVHEDLPDPHTMQSIKSRFRQFARAKETLCCTTMEPDKMREYHGRLATFKPKVLYGYPNAMAYFADFVKENALSPIIVETIICTAERLTTVQRRLLHEVFGGEVFNLYCTREHGCIGFECSMHDGFHIDLGSVYLEIIKNGKPARPGEAGEIVITDCLNYGMPFIRNRIGDRGALSTEECDCGCQLPLLKQLDGRVADMLYRPDGSMVSGLMLTDMFWDVPEIKALQVVQKQMDEVDIILEVTEGFNDRVRNNAMQEVREFMGAEMVINMKIVPVIPRNPVSGKFQEVICKVQPHP